MSRPNIRHYAIVALLSLGVLVGFAGGCNGPHHARHGQWSRHGPAQAGDYHGPGPARLGPSCRCAY